MTLFLFYIAEKTDNMFCLNECSKKYLRQTN
jgi:hypothetical protein